MRPLFFLTFICLLFGGSAMAANADAGGEANIANYQAYCVQCHGLQGTGKGVNVRDMSVQPRDHSDAKTMSARSDEDLFKVIKEGGLAANKSVLMPAWKDTLTDAEITGLVQLLREKCGCSYGAGGAP